MIENLGDFLERVYTFNLGKFFLIDKKLNPYKCAAYGYINSDINEISCKLCNCKIKIEIDDLENKIKADEDSLKKLIRSMKNSHKEECIFSIKNIKDFELFKITREFLELEWENFYSQNYSSFQNIDEKDCVLPFIDPIIEKIIPPTYMRTFTQENKFNITKMLSVFGWKLKTTHLFCNFCGRNILIKDYLTKNELFQSFEEKINLDDSSNKIFNPINEHRYFCKWGKIDKKGIKIYGWNICINKLFENFANNEEIKQFFDKKNEITKKIKYEILKSVEDIKKIKERAIKKYEEIEEINKKYQVKANEDLKIKIEGRKKNLEDIFTECGIKLESIIKKLKT